MSEVNTRKPSVIFAVSQFSWPGELYHKKMGRASWRRKVAIALYVVALVNVAVSVERMAFDVAGQMWLTLIINGIIAISSILCILGTFIRQKEAIIAFLFWALVSCAINLILILIYNDVGLLSMKEQYLGLGLEQSESWWKTHGLFCYRVCSENITDMSNEDGSSGQLPKVGGDSAQRCFIPYTVIETAHSIVNILLTLACVFLSCLVVCKQRKGHVNEGESFRYFNIGNYGGSRERSISPGQIASGSKPGRRRHYEHSDSKSGTLSSISTTTTGDSTIHRE